MSGKLDVPAVVVEIERRLAELKRQPKAGVLHYARRDELRVLRDWVQRGGV